MKRIFRVITALVMMFSFFSLFPTEIITPVEVKALTSSEITAAITNLKNTRYPDGYCWNNEYTDAQATKLFNGSQCVGFARNLANIIFGCFPNRNVRDVSDGTILNGWTAIKNVSSVQPGDIIHVYNHAAMVHYVDGNNIYVAEAWGSSGNVIKYGFFNGTRNNATLAQIKANNTFYGIWRANDSTITINPPTNVTLSKNQIWYDINDTIVLTPSAENATTFYMSITKDGIQVLNVQLNESYNISASDLGFGEYHAWITAVNTAGNMDSNGIDFSIVGSATYNNISTLKTSYSLNETISISVDTVCAKGQVIGIDKNGIERVITEECDSTFTIAASKLGVGQYSAYFSVYNGSGGIDTDRITFSIYDKAPTWGKLESEYGEYKFIVGNTISLIATSDYATGYWLGFDKGSDRIITEEMPNGRYSYKFIEPGEYSAYVSCSNGYGGIDSERIYFTVYDEVMIIGDINQDGKLNDDDAVLLQRWILAVPNTELADWKAGDFNEDNRLDVLDLALMKQALVE